LIRLQNKGREENTASALKDLERRNTEVADKKSNEQSNTKVESHVHSKAETALIVLTAVSATAEVVLLPISPYISYLSYGLISSTAIFAAGYALVSSFRRRIEKIRSK